MSPFLTRERFGSAQFIAGIILLAFLGQCVWFSSRVPLSDREVAFVLQGQREWRLGEISFHDQVSPMTGLLASLPLLGSHPGSGDTLPPSWHWLARLPFMLIGMLFGASIWYVARRLYGNIAGYIALILYAFSPWFIIHSAMVQPEVVAGWAAFGIVFTAIGVSHTLYAPREVILWNWRRILLLGTAIGVGGAAQPAVVVVVPIALGFMWYLVPERGSAATVILLGACVVGAIVDWAAYAFHFSALWYGLAHSHVFQFSPASYTAPITWSWIVTFFVRQQATATALLLLSLVTFAAWKRVRFFGTAAPLIVCGVLLLIGIGMPTQGSLPFYLILLPFAFVFIAGVVTDLLESRFSAIALGVVLGVLAGHIFISVSGLLRM